MVKCAGYFPSRMAKTSEVYSQVALTHDLVHLGCWAHCRRYVVGALDSLPKIARTPDKPASQFLALIARLYAVESHAHRWHRQLFDGTHASIADIAKSENINPSFVSRVLRLAYLSPTIVEAVTCTDGSGLMRTTAQFEVAGCGRLRLASYSRRTSICWFAAYALSFSPELSAAIKCSSHFDFFSPIALSF